MSASYTPRTGLPRKVLMMIGALGLAVLTPPPAPTDAGWVDLDYTAAQVQTATVPAVTQPVCETVRVSGTTRDNAVLTWDPPPGGLPDGMLYEIRAKNPKPHPGTQKSVFQTKKTYTYSDPVGGGNPHPPCTILTVEIFVVIPDSTTNPTTAVWETKNPATTWDITYKRKDVSRGSYRCPAP